MKNDSLAKDYLKRAQNRLFAVETLIQHQSWPDVVRESQEIIELALKALLRIVGIEPPRIHDVSTVLIENRGLIEKYINTKVDPLVDASKELRRDRELAFYGSEDLTPSDFYSE